MDCGGMFFGNGSTCGGGSPGCGGNQSYCKKSVTQNSSRSGSNSCGVGYTTSSCGGGGGCSAMRERRSARLKREEAQRESERSRREVLNQGRFPTEAEVDVRLCRNIGSCASNVISCGGTNGCGGTTPDIGGSGGGCGGNNTSLIDRFNQRRRGF